MIVISDKKVDDKVDTDAKFWPEFLKEEMEFIKDEPNKENNVGPEPADEV